MAQFGFGQAKIYLNWFCCCFCCCSVGQFIQDPQFPLVWLQIEFMKLSFSQKGTIVKFRYGHQSEYTYFVVILAARVFEEFEVRSMGYEQKHHCYLFLSFWLLHAKSYHWPAVYAFLLQVNSNCWHFEQLAFVLWFVLWFALYSMGPLIWAPYQRIWSRECPFHLVWTRVLVDLWLLLGFELPSIWQSVWVMMYWLWIAGFVLFAVPIAV